MAIEDKDLKQIKQQQMAYKPPANTPPAWTPPKKKKGNIGTGNSPLNSEYLTPSSLGGNTMIPNFNTPQSIAAGQLKKPQMPAWMNTLTNAIAAVNGGGNSWLSPMAISGPKQPGTQLSAPTAQPIKGTLKKPNQQTSGNNEVWVMPDGSTVNAIYPETTPSQSHPPGAYPVILPFVQQMLAGQGTAPTGYSGFGTTYGGNWGGGYGGGGGGNYPAWMNYMLRLNNWNI